MEEVTEDVVPSSAPPITASTPLSVEELMDVEFARIIGHDSIKLQLRQFYKKVQLDRIRQAHGKDADTQRLYHMIFSGPPGTGPSTTLSHHTLHHHTVVTPPCY